MSCFWREFNTRFSPTETSAHAHRLDGQVRCCDPANEPVFSIQEAHREDADKEEQEERGTFLREDAHSQT